MLYPVGVAYVTLHVFDGGVFHLSATDAVDGMPVLGQSLGNGFAKAGGGSGDDDYFVHSINFGRSSADITRCKGTK